MVLSVGGRKENLRRTKCKRRKKRRGVQWRSPTTGDGREGRGWQ